MRTLDGGTGISIPRPSSGCPSFDGLQKLNWVQGTHLRNKWSSTGLKAVATRRTGTWPGKDDHSHKKRAVFTWRDKESPDHYEEAMCSRASAAPTTLKAPRPSKLEPQSPMGVDSCKIQLPSGGKDKNKRSTGALWL